MKAPYRNAQSQTSLTCSRGLAIDALSPPRLLRLDDMLGMGPRSRHVGAAAVSLLTLACTPVDAPSHVDSGTGVSTADAGPASPGARASDNTRISAPSAATQQSDARTAPTDSDCVGHDPGVAFCDGDVVRVCNAAGAATEISCEMNERCLLMSSRAKCACVMGASDKGDGCELDSGCAPGACDPHTRCSVDNGKRSCTACPAGYVGDGTKGCAPTLLSLEASCGDVLAPSAGAKDYRHALVNCLGL